MKTKTLLKFTLSFLSTLLLSQPVLAQVPRPRPADSTVQVGALPQVFAMPAPPTIADLGLACASGQVFSGGTCVALTSGGGAGSLCGSARGNNGIVESVLTTAKATVFSPCPQGGLT